MRKLLLFLFALLTGVRGAWAQQTVTAGAQITDVANIVSGKAYLLQHQGNGTNKPWIEDKGTFYNCPNSAGNCNTASVWYLFDNGDGTWKIENAYTGKYWPNPTGNASLVGTTADNAGSWTLNMTDGVCAPTCNGFRLNRNTPYLAGWNSGSGTVTQMKIYEVSASTLATSTSYSELDAMAIIAGDEATSITEGQWYLMKNRGRNGYAYENSGSLKNTASYTKSATIGASYLVRFLNAGDGKYYIQNGLGNYFGVVTHNTAVPTTVIGSEKYTCGTINSTDGHFYFTSATGGVVLDCKENGYSVVGWNTTIPTETGGNNDWAIYPVTFEINPSASDVWTINNPSANRGAMFYYPSGSETYVWATSKSGTFDANNANCRWILYPSGIEGQYYLYNVGAQKFAVPTGSNSINSCSSWVFSENAVPVTFIKQVDGRYKIRSGSATNVYAAVSKNYDGPIINYNDDGGNFNITKVDNTSSAVTTELTTAMNKLIDGQTKLTSLPTETGWYAIKIRYNNSNLYGTVYTLEEETTNNSNTYPLGYFTTFNTQPDLDEAQHYVKLTKVSDNNYYIQLPNGKYIQNSTGRPVSGLSESQNYISYSEENHFVLKNVSNGYFYRPYNIGGYSPTTYFIGETGTSGSTTYDIISINLATAGLTAWTVSIEESTGTETLTCSNGEVKGLATVYNNGYIFLPTSTTPVASDFSVSGVSYGYQVKVDGSAKTITVVNSDAIFATLKSTTKFDILDGSTVMGPGEFANPTEINAAIDAAQEVADNAEAKIAFIESANGTKIQNYLNQVANYGALANIQITMSKEYGTLILPCPCTRISGLDIYSCSAAEGNVLTLTPVDGNYEQNVPYIIHATAGNKYTIIGWNKGSTATHTEGWLTGVLNSTTEIPSGSYMLATKKDTGHQAFYLVSGTGVLCAQNKCYLTVPSGDVKAFFLDIDGQETAIGEIFGDKVEQGVIYNLAGQRMSRVQKGVNIVNGKKVLVK